MTPEIDNRQDLASPGIRFAIPPLIFAGLSLAAGLAHWALSGFETSWSVLPLCWYQGLGILIGLSGCAFMMSAWFHFCIIGTTVTTNATASKLVEAGAFRYSRNPMYVGFVTLLVAGSIIFSSWPFLIAAGLMSLYLNFYVIPREELYLRAAFGERYQAYRERVRRWL